MGRASVASVPRVGFPDSLVFLGFLVVEESLIYRIDIREGRGKLNAFIILHEIQAVSPSSSAASYDENFFVLADVPVAQGGFTGVGISSCLPSSEGLEYFLFDLFARFQGSIFSILTSVSCELSYWHARFSHHTVNISLRLGHSAHLSSGSWRPLLCESLRALNQWSPEFS